MRILVCVKQVPEVSDVQVNPETGTLNREGVASILNPFCEYALDLALALREANAGAGIEIVALTMGPPQARMALMRCLEMGADRGILVTDRKFAGADSWATALTIARIVRTLEAADLIMVGKQAIDGDTAQVGPELAELLNIPQVTYATGLELDDKGRFRVRRETDAGYETLRMKAPGLVSASKGAASRKVCSFAEIINARTKPIRTMSADELGLDPAELGLQGSLTQVVKVFPPQAREAGRVIDGGDADAAAHEVMALLHERGVIEHAGR